MGAGEEADRIREAALKFVNATTWQECRQTFEAHERELRAREVHEAEAVEQAPRRAIGTDVPGPVAKHRVGDPGHKHHERAGRIEDGLADRQDQHVRLFAG